MVDGVATIIDHLRGNIVSGKILQSDLTTTPCYVVKQGSIFAHGRTIHKAAEALRNKMFKDMPEDERIAEFVEVHEWGVAYKNTDFFDWHHKLTGSCLYGRNAFAKDHNVDMAESMTVEDFVALTRKAYGGDIIERMAERYN